MEERDFSISWGSLWKVVAMLLLLGVAFVARDVLVAIILAIIISSALDPLVDWLEIKRIPRILGAILIYILALFLVAMVVYILLPVGLVEFNSLIEGTGSQLADISDIPVGVSETINDLTADFLGGGVTLLGIASKFLGGIITAIVIFILSFYMVLDRHGVKKFLITITPLGYQEAVLEVYRRVHARISSWFLTQLLLSLIVGLAVFIGLWVLGVPYSLILGVAAAVFELVPYVGPIFSGALAVLIAIGTSFQLAIFAAILFFLIQQLEAHILVPTLMGRSTNLSPVVVLIALLIGGTVFGIIGVILAVPVAVTVQEILYYWSGTQVPKVRVSNSNSE
ncbi:MAG: AI-2E family transporter [bacterium]|nr:AI-2E family transporter [bacterium]MDZ4209796.1 AI-2E family transporter [Candidatus Curtissbacteria bacterium]